MTNLGQADETHSPNPFTTDNLPTVAGISLARGPMDDAQCDARPCGYGQERQPCRRTGKAQLKIFEDNTEQTITRFRTSSKPVAAQSY
jgi:hypothetical protein